MQDKCPFCKKPIEGKKSHTCPNCGSIIASDAFESHDINPGEIFSGRYKIIKILGKGGMGTVYLAEETTLSTGRYVAIKLLPAHMTTDKSILSRFQEEIKTAASIDHPNIVPIYFVGEHMGLYYFVMKNLEGGTIYQMLSKLGPFSEKETRRILSLICDALDYAHSKGIVHRDIKASNIMISPDGIPTLMDFGVARSSETSELTLPGQIVGTAEYMAPEQWYGEAESRSDIYSLGIVMYYMLTGKLPYNSKNAFELMKMHQENVPASIRSQVDDISPEMEAICSWSVEKEKERRPSRASILASALRQEQDILTDHLVLPIGYEIDSDSVSSGNSTMNYKIPSDDLPPSIPPEEAEKFNRLMNEAEQAYKEGNLDKAVKIARKAALINHDSTRIEYRIKKYEHLQRTIGEIKNKTERKISGGFINQAQKDYKGVLTVYDIPEIRQRYEKVTALIKRVNGRYAEGKKLQLQGHYEKALKCFIEVVKYDAENADALVRKTDLIEKTENKKIKKSKKSSVSYKKIKRITIPLLVFFFSLVIIINLPTILEKSANSFYNKGKYSSPPLLNTYTFYRMLDFITGPDIEREKIIHEMFDELVRRGNVAREKNDLKIAIDCYNDAVKMLPDHSPDKEELEILIKKMSLQLKFE